MVAVALVVEIRVEASEEAVMAGIVGRSPFSLNEAPKAAMITQRATASSILVALAGAVWSASERLRSARACFAGEARARRSRRGICGTAARSSLNS